MKKLFFLITLITASLAFSVSAQEFPALPNRLVNDYTNTLDASQLSALEQKLVRFDDSSSSQIAICIIKSVGEYDIDDYAVKLGRNWGIGQKGQNNGILILVALGDRKISIQTGYGLEGALPDMLVRRVIDQDIKANFKQGKYYEGLDQAVNSIISITKNEYKQTKVKSKQEGSPFASLLIIVIIVVVIVIITKKGGNGGNGVITGRGGSGLAEALIFGALLGGRNNGGGGSWGGGDSGGGGFGGFGGGSFGGGGSSGSW